MEYDIVLTITVDPDANFLDVCPNNNLVCIRELIEDAIYEIDDVEIEELDVKERHS